ELLDNATAFSAPETHVTLATRVTTDHSLSIDVIDKGIGMNAAEVDEANNRIAEAASMDLSTSRRMGLFVVGRLAGKHGFRVTIHGGNEIGGVRANIVIPENVLAGRPSAGPLRAAQADDTAAMRQEGGGGALPRRTRRPSSDAGAAGFTAPEPSGASGGTSGMALFTPNATGDDLDERSRGGPPGGTPVSEDGDPDGDAPAAVAVSSPASPSSPASLSPPSSTSSAGESEDSASGVAEDNDWQPHAGSTGERPEFTAETMAAS